MGLRTALVDQARTVRQQPLDERVDGSTITAPVHGPWFKVRLSLPESAEAEDEPFTRRRVVRTPTLLMDSRDEFGDPVNVTNEDRLQIRSPELGEAEWEVTVLPQPIRKKKRILAFSATVRRVETRSFEAA